MTEKIKSFRSQYLKINAENSFRASFNTTARQITEMLLVTKMSQLKMTEMFQRKKKKTELNNTTTLRKKVNGEATGGMKIATK